MVVPDSFFSGSGISNTKVADLLPSLIPGFSVPIESILLKCLVLLNGTRTFIFLPIEVSVNQPSNEVGLSRSISTNRLSSSGLTLSILGLEMDFSS